MPTETSVPPADDLGEGLDAWRRFIDAAVVADDPGTTPFVLASVAVAHAAPSFLPEDAPRPGLPEGAPNAAMLRHIGTELLRWSGRTSGTRGATWRVLGLALATRHPKEGRGPVDELAQRLRDVQAAADTAADIDPTLHAWALIELAATQRNTHELGAALETAKTALAVARAQRSQDDTPIPVLTDATGGAVWVPGHRAAQVMLKARAVARVAIARHMLRDYAGAGAARDEQIEISATIRDQYPSLYASALSLRSETALSLGDLPTALRRADELAAWARDSTDTTTRRTHLRRASELALFLDDWDRARELRLERLRLCLAQVLDPVPALEPAAVHAELPALVRRGRRKSLTGIGNDAYELARLALGSGAAEHDPAARAEARAWLDVATDAWEDIALNGAVAVRYRLLEVDALDGSRSPLEVGRGMVECSRRWRRVAGRRRAAVRAARLGAPGDREVLARLEELTADAPTLDRARLDRGIARWHLRAADELTGDARTQELAEARRHAADSAAGLVLHRPDGTVLDLDPEARIDALQLQVDATVALRDAGAVVDGIDEAAELALRVATLPAVAQRFAASGSRTRRLALESRYRSWLRGTIVLAARLQDGDAVDQVAEVLRRDLVGTILYGLTQDEMAPGQIAELARELTATLNATVEDLDAGDDPSPGDPSPRHRAVTLDDQFDQTLDVMGRVLGPVARTLFDPRTVGDHTVTGALDSAYGTHRAAVLSLVLLPSDEPLLVRHLAWRAEDDGPVAEHLDVVPAPDWLAELEVGDEPHRFFARVTALPPTMLPAPLAALLATETAHPLPLTVVPTGLLGVPFTALVSGGRLVLETASVATAQSLQAVRTLAGLAAPDAEGTPPWDVAVYDLVRLTHTEEERAALLAQRPRTREPRTLAEMRAALADPARRGAIGILALAVHGTRGADGWAQVKVLPSGELLTTSHVLQWYLPRLVVGASCNTDIRSDAGGELGGFPLAFQLRGAATIVGSLHYVEDAATAEIMAVFYAAVGAGMGTADALRHAQLTWVNRDRAARLADKSRWAYLLCYGLPG
ncbi:CHAT domain-containing protein [Cellulomonas dongxiuzhuiae]|uniref:CHAT domain-containing protein n=1 Tax=Cellulomonas dongxiuzhuiae TaxID=2819979 RepID=UPI001AAE496B|nr:CHAT domain-containing protein [Cellulomonas dongxiuzhuiae]MBO3089476.1 CHAT domain-containing protein [Cellulomonas dongxiuzhuiae]